MNIIEIIIEVIFTPSFVLVGTLIGIIVAVCAWYYLPESINKTAIGGWAIALGFIGGWAFSYQSKKNK